MPYKHHYDNYTEQQKEKERERAREWHRKNYDKIKERKQAAANEYYKVKGRAKYEQRCLEARDKIGKLLQAAKSRCKKNQILFDLSLDYVYDLYVQQNKVCALTKREFYLGPAVNHCASDNSLSIDRITPSLGYTEGNVRLVIHHVNMAMSVFGLDALIKLVKDIEENK